MSNKGIIKRARQAVEVAFVLIYMIWICCFIARGCKAPYHGVASVAFHSDCMWTMRVHIAQYSYLDNSIKGFAVM